MDSAYEKLNHDLVTPGLYDTQWLIDSPTFKESIEAELPYHTYAQLYNTPLQKVGETLYRTGSLDFEYTEDEASILSTFLNVFADQVDLSLSGKGMYDFKKYVDLGVSTKVTLGEKGFEVKEGEIAELVDVFTGTKEQASKSKNDLLDEFNVLSFASDGYKMLSEVSKQNEQQVRLAAVTIILKDFSDSLRDAGTYATDERYAKILMNLADACDSMINDSSALEEILQKDMTDEIGKVIAFSILGRIPGVDIITTASGVTTCVSNIVIMNMDGHLAILRDIENLTEYEGIFKKQLHDCVTSFRNNPSEENQQALLKVYELLLSIRIRGLTLAKEGILNRETAFVSMLSQNNEDAVNAIQKIDCLITEYKKQLANVKSPQGIVYAKTQGAIAKALPQATVDLTELEGAAYALYSANKILEEMYGSLGGLLDSILTYWERTYTSADPENPFVPPFDSIGGMCSRMNFVPADLHPNNELYTMQAVCNAVHEYWETAFSRVSQIFGVASDNKICVNCSALAKAGETSADSLDKINQAFRMEQAQVQSLKGRWQSDDYTGLASIVTEETEKLTDMIAALSSLCDALQTAASCYGEAQNKSFYAFQRCAGA